MYNTIPDFYSDELDTYLGALDLTTEGLQSERLYLLWKLGVVQELLETSPNGLSPWDTSPESIEVRDFDEYYNEQLDYEQDRIGEALNPEGIV